MNATLTQTPSIPQATGDADTPDGFPAVDFDRLSEWRRTRKSVRREILLPGSPDRLWPYLSDTGALERRAGFAAPELDFQPAANGRFLTGRTRLAGQTLRFTELPFEWSTPHFHALERIFANGPFRYFAGRFDLQAVGADETKVTMEFSFVARYRLLPMTKMVGALMQKLAGTIRDLVAEIPAQGESGDAFATEYGEPLAARAPESHQLRKAIDDLTRRWSRDSDSPEMAETFSEFVLTRDPNVLGRLRPFALADYLGFERDATLRFCLHSVSQGYLEMQWDVLCPVCRGPSGERRTGLAHLSEDAHCDTCNIRYDVAFDENVEVTFRPASGIRAIDDTAFCPAAPSGTKHVLRQLFLTPGQTLEEELSLTPGEYRLRFDSGRSTATLRALASRENGSLAFDPEHLPAEPALSGTAPRLRLGNDTDRVQIVKIERDMDRSLVTTAHMVTTLQEFRDRFSSEVLRPGVHIGVKSIAVMFTDLKGSTRLYEREGDARALAIVQDHFERMTAIIARHDGAVVKTIGDAVMAVFRTPLAGLRAAREIQDSFRDWRSRDREVTLKLGVHSGPALALNRNERLDYFGTTINRAARLESQARGGDIVLSEEMFTDRDVQSYLKGENKGLRLGRFRSTLKGFDKESVLYRVEPLPHTLAESA